MKAIEKFEDLPKSSHLHHWLRNAEEALAELMKGRVLDNKTNMYNQLAQLNVLTQLEHLKQYPIVREKLEAGELILHGWYIEVEHATVHVFHPGRHRFIRIESDVVEELSFLDRVFAKTPSVRFNLHDPSLFQ